MKKGHYYAVLASNGVFVHPSYDRVVCCRGRYFRSPCSIRKFASATEALTAAREHLWEVIPEYLEIPSVLEVNVFYTPKSLSRKGGGRMKMEELKALCEEYPVCIPVRVAAKFIGIAEDCLRAAMDQNRCPFGFSWRLGERAGYKIPTISFATWLAKGIPLDF